MEGGFLNDNMTIYIKGKLVQVLVIS